MSIEDFHKSTADELVAIKDRVRSLVKHWGEDGSYKEAILKSAIKKVLPPKYDMLTGFVIKPDLDKKGEHQASSQIDLMVVDDRFPCFFKSGDFAVVTPDAVQAIIEVKANLENQDAIKVIHKAVENGKFIFYGTPNYSRHIFNGIFSYDGHEQTPIAKLQGLYSQGSGDFGSDDNFEHYCVNNVCFNPNRFFKFWPHLFKTSEDTCYVYSAKGLSFSFFISSLMEHLASLSVQMNNSMWFTVNQDFKVEHHFRFPERASERNIQVWLSRKISKWTLLTIQF